MFQRDTEDTIAAEAIAGGTISARGPWKRARRRGRRPAAQQLFPTREGVPVVVEDAGAAAAVAALVLLRLVGRRRESGRRRHRLPLEQFHCRIECVPTCTRTGRGSCRRPFPCRSAFFGQAQTLRAPPAAKLAVSSSGAAPPLAHLSMRVEIVDAVRPGAAGAVEHAGQHEHLHVVFAPSRPSPSPR